MNILHMKYAVAVAEAGSLNKASEKLYVALPNISRSIKELEGDLGINIFDRSAKGVSLTPEGEEFIEYARSLLSQFEQMENYYKSSLPRKKKFSISVPRASYISHAFVRFTNELKREPVEIFYEETSSQRTINSVLDNTHKLGIIRFNAKHLDYFEKMLSEKEINFEKVAEFSYCLLISKDSPLLKKERVELYDLKDYIEIAHLDPLTPSIPHSKGFKDTESKDDLRRIFVYERASQFDLLSENTDTYMWVSPLPQKTLEKYNLVQLRCQENTELFCDLHIYKKGYKLSSIDKLFIATLFGTKQKILNF